MLPGLPKPGWLHLLVMLLVSLVMVLQLATFPVLQNRAFLSSH